MSLDGLEFLVGRETETHFRGGLGGNHGLRAIARKPSHDAVDLERRERPEALQHRVVLEPRERFGLYAMLEEIALLEWKAFPGGELALGRSLDRRIEPGNVDLPVGRLEAAEQPGELLVGVGGGPAKFARVKVRSRRPDGDLGVAEPAQGRVDGGPAGRDIGHVGDEDDIGAGPLGLPSQQLEQDAAAVLFLPFDQEAEVDGRPAAGLDCFEETEHLSLVIRRAARKQLAVPHRRIERWRRPLVERLGRLDVIVPVDQERRRTGHVRTHAPDHRVRAAGEELHLARAEPAQLVRDPLRRGPTVGVVRRARRH